MAATIQIEGASRMMTRAELAPSGIRVYFADGKDGVIPLRALDLSSPPTQVTFSSPYELRVFTEKGEAPVVPWDFVRHFVDPNYEKQSRQSAIRGKKALGARLRQFRKVRKLTQAELARRAGISRVSVARIETGVHNPKLETISALAQALGITPSQLLTGLTIKSIKQPNKSRKAHTGTTIS